MRDKIKKYRPGRKRERSPKEDEADLSATKAREVSPPAGGGAQAVIDNESNESSDS